MKKITNFYNYFNSDSLYKNSIYLILSTAVLAVLGFFFWIINARLFTPEQVGIGTTLISAVTLLSSFCLLGLGNSLIRYLPTSERKIEKINTSFTIIGIASILISVFFLLFLKTFSPKLLFIRENIVYSLLFVLFVISSSLNSISENIFIAYRSSKYIFIKNTALSISKLIFPFLLITLGAYGIFLTSGIATTIALAIALAILISKFDHFIAPTINKEIIKRMIKFSMANYIAGLIGGLPAVVLPIFITNSIGAEYAAYFYMDMMVAGFLYVIPMATSQSLFAEGSYDEKEIPIHLKKAIIIIALILIPAILASLLFGKYILLAFGKEYSTEGVTLLRLLTLSGVFISINYLGNTLLYIKHKIKLVILLNLVNTSVILTLSYLFIKETLLGIGLAWAIGNGLISLYFLVVFAKKRFIQS